MDFKVIECNYISTEFSTDFAKVAHPISFAKVTGQQKTCKNFFKNFFASAILARYISTNQHTDAGKSRK